MASVHRQAHSIHWKIAFAVPKSGVWFRSSGFRNKKLATIVANVLELEAEIAGKQGMTEETISQLERILNDLFEYFNGRERPAANLVDFVDESVSIWRVGISARSGESLNCCKKNFIEWAQPKVSSVKAFTFGFINDYFRYLNSSSLSRATVVKQRGFVTRLAKRAKELKLVREDLLSGGFVKCKPKQAGNTQQHGITNEELQRVYEYLDKEISNHKSNI